MKKCIDIKIENNDENLGNVFNSFDLTDKFNEGIRNFGTKNKLFSFDCENSFACFLYKFDISWHKENNKLFTIDVNNIKALKFSPYYNIINIESYGKQPVIIGQKECSDEEKLLLKLKLKKIIFN